MSIKSEEIKQCIGKLANNIRAERIDYNSYLDLYSGNENIRNINNINNTVVYGRRGSGKTHLLKALSEEILNRYSEDKIYPVYIDLRRIIPLVSPEIENKEIDALLIFKYLIQEVSLNLHVNIPFITEENEFNLNNDPLFNEKKEKLDVLFESLYLEFDGRELKKSNDLKVSLEEIKSLSGEVNISKNPSAKVSALGEIKKSTQSERRGHISILHITNALDEILETLDLRFLVILVDEWSEIPREIQPSLAEIFKKTFSAINVVTKIAAIPNRTMLGIKTESKFFGLEEGEIYLDTH